MSMYNIVFGISPGADSILATLGLTRQDVGRFRDCFVAEGEIAIYTRNGGGNRHCINQPFSTEVTADCNEPSCYGCCIQYRLPKHPHYLRDADDNFDSTYATIYFSLPERYEPLLKCFDIGKFDPDKRWLDQLEKLKDPAYQLPARMQPLMDKLEEILTDPDEKAEIIS